MKEEGKFVGINWITGRKIYLTPEEEAIIKKQRTKIFKTFWWILGIYIGLIIIVVCILMFSGN